MGRTITGRVTSDKPDKTIVVRVDIRKTHPVYRKQYTVSKKFHAHDELNEARQGDLVEVTETAPVSKLKSWKLVRVIERPVSAEDEITNAPEAGAVKNSPEEAAE